uniref:Uncharacterized protein n=1 Tax=Aegilops tauschii TaxID=37682 RepID=R7WB53_AEGTA
MEAGKEDDDDIESEILRLEITEGEEEMALVEMRVLSWVQSRLRGAQYSAKKPEFNAGSYRPAAGDTDRSDDELHRHRQPAAAMLSIGTFGVVQGHGVDELRKMQEELTLLMGAKGVTTQAGDEDDKMRRRTLKRSLSGATLKHRSFRKLMSPTPSFSFRGRMPEMPWPLPHNDIPSDDLEAAIKSYHHTAQLP